MIFSSCTKEKNPILVLHTDKELTVSQGITSYKGKALTGKIVAYSSKKMLLYSCDYTNGRKNGEEKKWHSNGLKEMYRLYSKGVKIGVHKGWWENSNKKFEYHFNSSGAYQGEVKEWFRDGTVYRTFNYLNGREDGSQKMYKPDGSIRANYVVVAGERFGLIGLKTCDPVSTM